MHSFIPFQLRHLPFSDGHFLVISIVELDLIESHEILHCPFDRREEEEKTTEWKKYDDLYRWMELIENCSERTITVIIHLCFSLPPWISPSPSPIDWMLPLQTVFDNATISTAESYQFSVYQMGTSNSIPSGKERHHSSTTLNATRTFRTVYSWLWSDIAKNDADSSLLHSSFSPPYLSTLPSIPFTPPSFSYQPFSFILPPILFLNYPFHVFSMPDISHVSSEIQ